MTGTIEGHRAVRQLYDAFSIFCDSTRGRRNIDSGYVRQMYRDPKTNKLSTRVVDKSELDKL